MRLESFAPGVSTFFILFQIVKNVIRIFADFVYDKVDHLLRIAVCRCGLYMINEAIPLIIFQSVVITEQRKMRHIKLYRSAVAKGRNTPAQQVLFY